MSILITGSASGFLGMNLLEYFSEHLTNQRLIIPYRQNNLPVKTIEKLTNATYIMTDIYSGQHVSQLFKTFDDIDTVIHLAAQSSARNGTYELLDNNLKTTFNLLEYCKQGTRFIFASSILVYNTKFNGGFTETDRTNPSTIYGLSKLACENLINIYTNNGKIRPIILRFSGIVGNYMSHGRIYEALKGRKEFKLFGKAPGSSLPYLHVKDACKVLVNASNYKKFKLTANICPDDNISLEESLKLVNPNISLIWDNSNIPSEYIHGYNETANYELDFRPSFSSKEAILAAMKEYNENIK